MQARTLFGTGAALVLWLAPCVAAPPATVGAVESAVAAAIAATPDATPATAPAVGVGKTPKETLPPVILVLPPEMRETGAARLLARVTDPSGVREVTLWYREPGKTEYRAVPMEFQGEGRYRRDVPFQAANGEPLSYYVEATDRLGNGPIRSASPDRPFFVRAKAESTTQAQASGNGTVIAIVIFALVTLGLLIKLIARRMRDQTERRFWWGLVEPLLELPGPELRRAIKELCAVPHQHPTQGRIRINREDALYWVGLLRRDSYGARKTPPAVRVVAAQSRPGNADARNLEVEMFWLQTLAPVLELPEAEMDCALDLIAAEPLAHPHHGIQIYSKETLRERLRWSRSVCPYDLLDRWKSLHIDDEDSDGLLSPTPDAVAQSPPMNGARGASLIELVAVLAILAIAVGLGALFLRPMETPLRNSGRLLEVTLKQARAKAMSTTSACRVRPVSAGELAVEQATSCDAGAWTLDPNMGTEFADQVALTDTGWTACFNSRGIASDNLILTLTHPSDGTEELELLLGGTIEVEVNDQRGFSLVEALVAVGVLVVAMLAILPAFYTQLGSNTRSDEKSGAVVAVQMSLESLRMQDPASLPSSGASAPQLIEVAGRGYEIVTKYCTNATYCGPESRHLLVEAWLDGRMIFNAETVYTQFL